MILRGALRRHQPTIGAALSIHRNRPGPLLWALLVAFWMLIVLAIVVNPPGGLLISLALPLLAGAGLVAFMVMISGEVLVVGERGLLIGSVAPFTRPYAISYAAITPGSVVPVTDGHRYLQTLGRFYAARTTRTGFWIRRGIHLVGPSPDETRAKRTGSLHQGGTARSVDGRWIWFAGTGRTRPELITAQIADAAGRSGLPQLAAATAAAPPRAASGSRTDSSRLLPGAP